MTVVDGFYFRGPSCKGTDSPGSNGISAGTVAAELSSNRIYRLGPRRLLTGPFYVFMASLAMDAILIILRTPLRARDVVLSVSICRAAGRAKD